ncbi:MAG: TnsA endonuclease N-terminal domain-containing protein [Bacteroidia bacterium]
MCENYQTYCEQITKLLKQMQTIKKVRQIGPGQGSLRGQIHSVKNETSNDFESALERDYFSLLEFDSNVETYIEQPVEIKYEFEGKTRHYTPDVLIYYSENRGGEIVRCPLLVEVKYRDNIRKKWKEYKPKFRAGISYALEKGWKFKIITEREIRTSYLENVKFLLSYKSNEYIDFNDKQLLMKWMTKLGKTNPAELTMAAAWDKNKQAELLYCLWHLVSTMNIGCDLHKPLNMKSELWNL